MLAAQQLREQLPVEARRHGFQRFAVHRHAFEDGVRRHHARDMGIQRTLERGDMFRKRGIRQFREAAVIVVRIETAGLRAVANPVLHDRGDAIGAHAILAVLEAFDVCANETRHGIRTRTERAGDARPARFRRKIRLRRKRHVDADGAIFLARDIAEAPNQFLVADGCEPERLRPLREASAAVRCAENVLEVAARIGADRDRNSEPRPFRDCLDLVVLFRKLRGRKLEACDEAVHVLRADGLLDRLEVVALRRCAGLCAETRQRVVHHRARFFLERHALHEVVRARVGRQAIVFVGVELVVVVEIAKARGARAGAGASRVVSAIRGRSGRARRYAQRRGERTGCAQRSAKAMRFSRLVCAA